MGNNNKKREQSSFNKNNEIETVKQNTIFN